MCVSVRGTTVICSNTHTNAANRAQTGEEPGTRRKAKKRKANTSAEAMESGKGMGEGEGGTTRLVYEHFAVWHWL